MSSCAVIYNSSDFQHLFVVTLGQMFGFSDSSVKLKKRMHWTIEFKTSPYHSRVDIFERI